MAILKTLAEENGYACENAAVLYETEWFYATCQDIFEKPERLAIFKNDSDEEAQTKCIAILESLLDRFEARWSDGRSSVGSGEGKTAADFYLLSLITSCYENEATKHERIKVATRAKLAACPNVNRVLDPMKELCRATIDALPPWTI